MRDFVHLTAQRPQLHRMLTFEGRSDNERLRWWISEYVRDFYAQSTRLIREAQKAGVARAGHPGRLHYAMIAVMAAKSPYSFVAIENYGNFGIEI